MLYVMICLPMDISKLSRDRDIFFFFFFNLNFECWYIYIYIYTYFFFVLTVCCIVAYIAYLCLLISSFFVLLFIWIKTNTASYKFLIINMASHVFVYCYVLAIFLGDMRCMPFALSVFWLFLGWSWQVYSIVVVGTARSCLIFSFSFFFLVIPVCSSLFGPASKFLFFSCRVCINFANSKDEVIFYFVPFLSLSYCFHWCRMGP